MVNGEEEYEVEAILRHKDKGAQRLYLVMWKRLSHHSITEASWELELHLQNATLILEDYLRHVGAEDPRRHRNRGGPEKELMVALGEYKATGALQLKDLLDGIYTQGEIAFSALNLRGWFYRLCTGAASNMLKVCLGWCGASSLTVSGFDFLGDLFTILSASEDSRIVSGCR